MKRFKSSSSLLGAAVIASAAALSLMLSAPVRAEVTTEQLATAEQECVSKAQADGYTLNSVVSKTAKDADTVEVVLDLTKTADGTQAKLTCPYSLSKGFVGFGDPAGATSKAAGLGPLWWLLVPLIGLPLLLAAVRGRGVAPVAAAGDRAYTEAYVNTHGEPLDVWEQPTNTSKVVGTLRDTEHVYLTGRHSDGWVELKDGGWVPNYYLSYADAEVRAVY